MSNFPSGTVTFLFTDVEGSTKLAQEYPDQWEDLRARHHAILQSAMDTYNGYVFQIIGDAFCVAFHTAIDGFRAAIVAQRNLQCEDWGETPIKVRMGLHSGTAELYGNEYRGYLTMAKVQRVMAVAYGGQILLSNASAELIHNELPKEIALHDMKEHRLKGLLNPERLWQIVAPDLQQEFPPLLSLKEIPNNLPVQFTSFIGRDKEVGQIRKRLDKNRLVTLTGSGGVGKTRLSIEVASEMLSDFPHGVWLVELAPITDPELVTRTVCAALDVTPQGNVPALNVLTEYLKSKKILLVVDNCEHLIDACAQLCDSLLHSCPDVRMIASSREALGIDGENAYRVPSLSLSDPNNTLENIKQSEAVQLFVERANTILPGYALTETNASNIAEICQRLDGIALAIELAASRVKLLKVDQIKARLEDAFRLLTGGSRTALPRQQTLRGTIDWSYNLLSEEERTVLRCLSVFIGGWALDAAESVCVNANMLNLLTRLVDKSLVAVDREHSIEPRYYLLETIRQYAREKLAESGEGEQARARHLEYFLRLAQRGEPELYGAGQIEWSQKLEDEYENTCAALEWSLQGNVTMGQQLAAASWWSWDFNGHLSEGYEWLGKILAMSVGDETRIRAKLLSGAGWLAELLGYRKQSVRFSEESVALFRQLGDLQGTAFPLATLGVQAFHRSDFGQATALFEESCALFREAGNKWGMRHTLGGLGYTAEAQGDFPKAQKFYEKSLSICKDIGDMEGTGWTLYIIGWLAESQGDDYRAIELYEQALEIEKAVRSKVVTSWILSRIGNVSFRHEEYQRGRAFHEEALEMCRKMGDLAGMAYSLQWLGHGARVQGDYPRARSYYAESLQLLQRAGDKGDIARCLIHVGKLMQAQGFPEKFVRTLGIAEAVEPDILKNLWPPFFRIETEKIIETAHAALGDESYAAALQSGKKMSLNEAIAYALRELQ